MANKWREDKCKVCGCDLIIGTNWTEYRKKNYEYICRDCKGKKTLSYNNLHREHYLARHRRNVSRRKKELDAEIRKIMGDKCVICGFSPVCAHEKYCKRHTDTPYYILKHINDFVPLCRGCHRMIHFCEKYLNLSWDDILRLRETKLRNEK